MRNYQKIGSILCGGLNEKCPLQTPVSEHFLLSGCHCLGRFRRLACWWKSAAGGRCLKFIALPYFQITLCFVFDNNDVISQLPVPVIMPAMAAVPPHHDGLYPFGAFGSTKRFLPYVQEKARVLMTGIYYFEIVIFHVLCAREVLIVRQLRLSNFLLSIPCGCFPQTSLDQQRTDSMS